jgi:hypothetical protein
MVNTLQDLAMQLALGTRDDALLSFGIASLREHLAAPESRTIGLSEVVVAGRTAAAGKPRRLRRKESVPPDGRELVTRCGRIDRLILSRSPATAALIRTVIWRAMASSDLALLGVLRRYRSLLHQARDAARSGRSVNRAALKSLVGEAADQLILWDLMPGSVQDGDLILEDLEPLNQLIAEVKATCDLPDLKSSRLAALVQDEKSTLVFAGARETVRYLRERIPRAAWCTGAAAGIGFTGKSREDVLSWFRPAGRAPGVRGPTVLLTTDVSSEGLDLQRTSRVVHYDLPWTAVRIDQRDGRALRLGSTHDSVEVIRFELPPVIEQRLGQPGALAHKRRLPRKAGMDYRGARLWRGREEIAERFGRRSDGSRPLVCTVESENGGILAGFALNTPSGRRLSTVAGFLGAEGTWSEDPALVSRMMETALKAPELETIIDNTGPVPGRVAELIQHRLRSATLGQWTARLSPRQSSWISRLNRMASLAVRLRNSSRLAAVERAMACVRQGHTAGEEMLLEGAFALSDSGLIGQLRNFPEPEVRGMTIVPELIGLVMFAPHRIFLPCPRPAFAHSSSTSTGP